MPPKPCPEANTAQDRHHVITGLVSKLPPAAHMSARPRRGLLAALLAVLLLTGIATAPPAQADTATIVALGDSLVHGYGLAPEEGLVPQLQRWLDATGLAVTLVNAGVSGDTSAGGRARAGWVLDGGADGLILALGGNDALRGIDPEVTRQNLDAILAEAGRRGTEVLLVGIRAPGNFGPEYAEAFNRIFPELAARHGVTLHPDLLAPLTGRADRAETLRRHFQPDALHPNAAGVALIVEDIGPAVAEMARRILARHAADAEAADER